MTKHAEYVSRNDGTYTAFVNQVQVFQGPFATASWRIRDYLDNNGLIDEISYQQILVFDDVTGERVDVEIRKGTFDTVVNNMQNAVEAAARRKVGRPKLGVVSREVSLLPRHWQWLEGQRGGASAALRRLVDGDRKVNLDSDWKRKRAEAADKFMYVMAGDLPGYEEATRALYAHDTTRLASQIAGWPDAVQSHILYLLDPPFSLQG